MEAVTKQWYIVYTKEGAEQKVCNALKRKKLDSFYPTNKITRLSYGRERHYYKPLLSRYVFVCLTDEEAKAVRNTDGIVSLVHWRSEPITVAAEDIFLLNRFFKMHDDIRVEKIKVNPFESATISGFLPSDAINDISLSLPSLGYILTARQKEARVKVITIPGYQTKTKLHSEYAEER